FSGLPENHEARAERFEGNAKPVSPGRFLNLVALGLGEVVSRSVALQSPATCGVLPCWTLIFSAVLMNVPAGHRLHL
ncbi:MAG: hypothetical protein ACRDRU_15550, partial [Pseudonocardiaceae bacterium]